MLQSDVNGKHLTLDGGACSVRLWKRGMKKQRRAVKMLEKSGIGKRLALETTVFNSVS